MNSTLRQMPDMPDMPDMPNMKDMPDIKGQKKQKKQFRQEAVQGRDALPLESRIKYGEAIKEQLFALEPFRNAHKVLLYASFRSEVNTEPMIVEALKIGKTVVLPRVLHEEARLTKHIISGFEELTPGHWGIPEPDIDKHEQIKVEDIHLLVVPGLAFDTKGARIGYGGGYYDKLLSRIKGERTIVALAFEAQIFESLPMEEHDIPVDYIITEQRTINCHG